MIRKYTFSGDGTIEFEDTRSVRELVGYALDAFGYYEPFGIETLTLFQCHHSKTNVGWFTTDLDKSCADEIEDPNRLCFAYNIPNVLYYAEGGWGHHMKELGNHPHIDDPVALHLRFEDFANTVVFNGNYSFRKVVNLFKSVGYLPNDAKYMIISAINPYRDPYIIDFSDPIMDADLRTFEKTLPNSVVVIDIK